VGACFGGYLAIYPAVTADFYGTKNVGLNYGFVFTAYGVGGLLSNIFGPKVKEMTGDYNFAFILTAALCIVSGFVVLLLKAPAAKASGGGEAKPAEAKIVETKPAAAKPA
jgi:OFA family oxalate/formate antiporter-like MFS transporter